MNQAAVKTTSVAPVEAGVGFSCAEEVANRISRLFGDERLADISFVVQQYEDAPIQKFVGHRNIISTWSEVLKSMLCGDFAESEMHEVHIRDVEPEAFEAMLKLMYCGTAEITFDNVLAILDVSVRFDVAPLVQFCVQFLQNHTSSEHACRMLEVGVQYSLSNLMDKCIELIVTDDHILESEDFQKLPQAALIELAKHDSWNLHEDEIYDTMLRWAGANSQCPEEQAALVDPILEHIRYPHMSVEKLKKLSSSNEVPKELIFDALFFKLDPSGEADTEASQLTGRYRPRPGSLLFSWVPTPKVTVSGDNHENARHTSSNGFTGIRGDRRMQHGIYSWTVNIAETQSSWIFVGIAQADDPNDVAWRSTGRMLYCLDSRYFHQGSGQNHPHGDRKIGSGTCVRVTLDCTQHTLAFAVNNEKPQVLFQDLADVAYVPAVDLRDCGDKVRLIGGRPDSRVPKNSAQLDGGAAAASSTASPNTGPQGVPGGMLPEVLPSAAVPMAMHEGGSGDPGRDDRHSSAAHRGDAHHSDHPYAQAWAPPPVRVPPRADSREPIARGDVPAATRRVPAAPLSSNEVHAALGISHHPAGAGGSNARMSQPRQSQGSQGSATVPNFDRGVLPSLQLEPLSLLEEERETTWDPQGIDFRNDMVPPN